MGFVVGQPRECLYCAQRVPAKRHLITLLRSNGRTWLTKQTVGVSKTGKKGDRQRGKEKEKEKKTDRINKWEK
jgi:hypothetical protein